MITTLGQFLTGLPRNSFFVSEPEEDGTRSYYPIEDLESIPGDDPIWANEIVVQWLDDDTALLCNLKADGLCKLLVSKHKIVAPKPAGHPIPRRQATYLFPVANMEAIIAQAEMLATLNESWKRDNCTNGKELLKEALEYAQLDFDRRQPPDVYWTDNEREYQRLFAVAYAQEYRCRVYLRSMKIPDGNEE